MKDDSKDTRPMSMPIAVPSGSNYLLVQFEDGRSKEFHIAGAKTATFLKRPQETGSAASPAN